MSAVLKLTSSSLRVAHKQIFTANRLLYPAIHKGQLACNTFAGLARPAESKADPGYLAPIFLSKRFSSNQDSSSSGGGGEKSQGSNTKWIFLALLLTGAGAAGISYQYGYFDKAGHDSSKSKSAEKKKKRVPLDVSDIPKEVPYLLIGGGTASFAAFRAIKSHEPKAKVMVISSELEMPYMRPPLSKEIWYDAEKKESPKRLTFRQWNGVERSIFYEPDDFYTDPKELLEAQNGGVAVVRGYHVKRISVDEKKAILDDGTEIKYEKCLIATGSVPKMLDVFKDVSPAVKDRVSVFKTIDHFEALVDRLDKVKSVAIIGGGFLGSEMACALTKFKAGKSIAVHQVFRERGNMGKVLPQYLSGWTTERVKEEGVTVHNECNVTKAEAAGKQVKLELSDGSSLLVDHVIVAVGTDPNTELAEVSKLETDPKMGGFIVNAELLARNSVYVAGDASNFYDPHLGRRRVEHHDHAVVSGRLAGENMVGLNKPYRHQSMFWSDLGPRVGYEAIGLIDSSLKTVAIFAKSVPKAEKQEGGEKKEGDEEKKEEASPVEVVKEGATATANADEFDKGLILYLRDERIVGILLWNVFNRMNIARKVIDQDIRTTDYNEIAKLFNIHEGHE